MALDFNFITVIRVKLNKPLLLFIKFTMHSN